ncbi:MAG: WecB/TagA/CpsF family glycosyltransferase [Candidatus Omnitrophica bacterium]|nr:WecB/TagA/CpsF family glycosyltransferase [Candidatus Omnitrophota bacterium]
MIEKFDLFGVRVSITDLDRSAKQIQEWVKNKYKTYVCVAPVATIVDAFKDETYRKIVNNAGMVTPDGVPIVWMGKKYGYTDIKRTCGPDLMKLVCSFTGYKHFFYGGDDQLLKNLAANLRILYSDIKIAGSYAPGKLRVGEKESASVIEQINASDADILWVGLGSPKQDIWMAEHRAELNVPVMVGVGAAFDFLAGVKKRAPLWMQKIGLEWFYRLCSEPKRLWKRYLWGNLIFSGLVIRDVFKFRKNQ